MRMSLSFIRKILLATFVVSFSFLGMAQPGGGDPGGGDDPDIPIDGGISILIALGVGASGYKIFKTKE